MSDENWLYHLTAKSIALKVKSVGMTSALTRIGIPVANPQGAFAQNRQKMESAKFEQKLTGYLSDVLSRGCTKEKIKEVRGQYVPFSFVPRGSNEADFPRLTLIENQRLECYVRSIPSLGKPERKKKAQFRRDLAVKQLAQFMLRSDKNHFLARLAVQCVAFGYKIEESITASHLYFLKPRYAVEGYNDYKKHLNAADMVMLRVHKNNVPGLVDDDSDHRAAMTKQTVGPGKIEVMKKLDHFTDLAYRCDAKNWQPLSALT